MFCTVADVIAEALVLSSNPALWAWWAMQHGLHSCLKSSNLSLFAGFQSSAGGCYRTWPRKCWHEGGSPVSNGVLRLNHPDHRSPSSVKVPHAKVFSIFTPTAGKKQWRQEEEQQQLQQLCTSTVRSVYLLSHASHVLLHLTFTLCLFELRCTISNLLPCPIELLVEQ